jgi:hypothetical protein
VEWIVAVLALEAIQLDMQLGLDLGTGGLAIGVVQLVRIADEIV